MTVPSQGLQYSCYFRELSPQKYKVLTAFTTNISFTVHNLWWLFEQNIFVFPTNTVYTENLFLPLVSAGLPWAVDIQLSKKFPVTKPLASSPSSQEPQLAYILSQFNPLHNCKSNSQRSVFRRTQQKLTSEYLHKTFNKEFWCLIALAKRVWICIDQSLIQVAFVICNL